jgi:hypothetical protein
MNEKPCPAKGGAPHPLVTLGGALISFTLLLLALKTTLLSRATVTILAISSLVVFRWISRRSAKTMRERREREMAELRNTPVLHLND